jgi:uncharacterized membrane protein YkgB
MKYLITTSRNIIHAAQDDEVLTEIEAVLGVQEEELHLIGGRITPTTAMSTFRFAMTIKTAEALVVDLATWIDEARKEAKRMCIKDE